MSGWRDTEGRTAAERRKTEGQQQRARCLATARHRPLTALKGLAGVALILVLALALIGFIR